MSWSGVAIVIFLLLPALPCSSKSMEDGLPQEKQVCSRASAGVSENKTFGVSLTQRWHSAQCQRFYAHEEACISMNASRQALHSVSKGVHPQTCVREDLALGGREYSTDIPDHVPAILHVTEAIVVDEYKFAYILNRKVGSKTIRHILSEVFGVSENAGSSCAADSPDSLLRGGSEKRCTTLTLTPTALQEYFFFTFVRNPIDRFYSGVEQAMKFRWLVLDPDHCHEQLEEILLYAEETRRSPNDVLESQALALSSLVYSGGSRGMLAFDWVESIDHLADSLDLLLDRIELNAGKCIPPDKRALALRLVRSERRNRSGGSVSAACRSAALDELVARVYAQDVACGF